MTDEEAQAMLRANVAARVALLRDLLSVAERHDPRCDYAEDIRRELERYRGIGLEPRRRSTTFADAVAAALDAGIGFTIQRPTRDSTEAVTLTAFVDDDGEVMLMCEGAQTTDDALGRIVEVAAEQKAGWS